MAKKVTISIPDMLHEKMEKWRESFNLSKMFQEAITEAIQRKEEFQKRIREDLDLNQIVDRLRREKLQSEGNYYQAGKTDGLHWAKTAHYDELLYALNWDTPEGAATDPILGEYFQQMRKSNRLLQANTYNHEEYVFNYVKGWKRGVEQFWDEIKDKL